MGTELEVVETAKPPQSDPTGSGAFLVNDILATWPAARLDPFLLWHEAGPKRVEKPLPLGMHPHRGFVEAPYFKKGPHIMIDRWNPGNSEPTAEGHMQWGKIGRGIEHGGRFVNSYRGMFHVFQLWVNLPAERKLDEAHFQDALPESLPKIVAPGATATVLLGSVGGVSSPIDQRDAGTDVAYVDVELEPEARWEVVLPSRHSTIFAYVAAGTGSVCGTAVSSGEVARLDGTARRLALRADTAFAVMIISGAPMGVPVAQHGPFVMTDKAELRQAFLDYQTGRLCGPSCDYTVYSADGGRRDFSRSIAAASASSLCW